jgi:hypothetical protein
MITGAHSIIYSKDPEADRAFLREVIGLPSVDVGEGWLIFGLPPAEVAVHPSRKNGLHEFYLICADAQAFVRAMKRRRVACSAVQDHGWGLMTQVTLPGGGQLGVYEPRHARPRSVRSAQPKAGKARQRVAARKPARKVRGAEQA